MADTDIKAAETRSASRHALSLGLTLEIRQDSSGSAVTEVEQKSPSHSCRESVNVT